MSLKAYFTRIDRLLDELDATRADIKEVYDEAKSAGYDVKVLRKVVARRRADPDQIKQLDMMIETYERELGQLSLPGLERAA